MTKLQFERKLVHYRNNYFVSNCGQIFKQTKKRLKPLKLHTAKGYYIFTLSDGSLRLTKRVHQVVLEMFVGPRPQNKVVNHKDGNKLNNHVSNLEYVTISENYAHALRTGLYRNWPNQKVSESKHWAMLQMRTRGYGYKTISRKFKISETQVANLLRPILPGFPRSYL